MGPTEMRMGSGEGSSEELDSLYCSSNIVRVIKYRTLRWAGHVARMEEGRSAFKILTGKGPLRRSRRRLEDNIRTDLQEIMYQCRGIGLIRLRIGIIGEPL